MHKEAGHSPFEACEECFRALSQRKHQEPRAPWPTFEEYQAIVEAHPEPMFASEEEMDNSDLSKILLRLTMMLFGFGRRSA